MEGFMINLKTFLGLAMPNQSCLDVTKQILCWFFLIFWDKKFQAFMIPIYNAIVLYDTHF